MLTMDTKISLTSVVKYVSVSVLFLATVSFVLMQPKASAEALVGEIVLVAGECPAGYLPATGASIPTSAYPELGAVLNRRASQGVEEIRLGNLTPVFQALDPQPIGAQSTSTRTSPSADNLDDVVGDLSPKYCIAAGGDTPPVVEVGLKFTQGPGASGQLDFFRVDVSGIEISANDPRLADFFQGDIDLSVLAQVVPGITRPNVRFRLVNENACRAYENFRYVGRGASGEVRSLYSPRKAFPGELRLTGVQISTDVESEKALIKWGNDFDAQRMALIQGGSERASSFTYTAHRDEQGRYGFAAVDIIDERTLIFENRNIVAADYQYRVQAQCGDPGNAYNVYYDPILRSDGRGGSGAPPDEY